MFRLEATSEPRLRRSENIPEITSSQEQEQSSLTLCGGRAIVIVTVTSPTTSFVFSTTTIKKIWAMLASFSVCRPGSPSVKSYYSGTQLDLLSHHLDYPCKTSKFSSI